jgi:hypothetical protein
MRAFLRLVLVGVAACFCGPVHAQKKEEGPKDKGKPGGVIARTKSAFDTIWLLPGKGAPRTLELYGEIKEAGRVMTPPGQRGVLEVKEGDLRVTLIGGLPELAPTPVLETVVHLQPAKEHDLDLRLERGIVLLEAGKDSPGGKVILRIQDKAIVVDLHKASAVALEMYSWWPVGVRLPKKTKPGVEPVSELWFFLLRGKADVVLEGERHALTAPLLYRWDSFGGVQGPVALKKAPDWVEPSKIKDAEVLRLLRAGEKIRRSLEKEPRAWVDALSSKETPERVMAVYRAIANDDVAAAVKVLNEDKSTDVRRAAVHAIRHFVGRGTEQVNELHQALADAKFQGPGILTYLLQGFGPEERNRPELYDTLISHLGHDMMAIRHLAAEQLTFLAPVGKEIGFDPAAAPEARMKAQEAWRKLIPEGSVPKVEKK